MRVLVTGAAGFIGYHVAKTLLARGDDVVGLDNLNNYYDPSLKLARLAELDAAASQRRNTTWMVVRADVADASAIKSCFSEHEFDRVIHLAAQAGVRYSLENPACYIQSNVVGFANILEACRDAKTPHLTYASTSSVYGANRQMPFSEHHGANHPLQLYAATKRSNELMAHSYSHLFNLPTTGLRFFTVYGPWGRPDMAPMLFARSIIDGVPIRVYNHGNHSRDFTFVDDIVRGVIAASDNIAQPDATWDPYRPNPATSSAPYRVMNIGNSQPVKLRDFIGAIERAVGKTALVELLPLQPGDVPDTLADVSLIERELGFRPSTPVEEGVRRLLEWYRGFYEV